MGRKTDRTRALGAACLVAGLFLMTAGIELRAVETFVLRPGTTRLLAQWVGPERASSRGFVQQLVLESSEARKAIHPPEWLGWACVTSGITGAAYGLLVIRRR